MHVEHLSAGAKHVGDLISVGVVVGTFAQILPHIAALMTIVWLGIRIWESDTIRGLTKRPLTGSRDED